MTFKVGDRVKYTGTYHDVMYGTITDDIIGMSNFASGRSEDIEVLWDGMSYPVRPALYAIRLVTKLEKVLK